MFHPISCMERCVTSAAETSISLLTSVTENITQKWHTHIHHTYENNEVSSTR